MGELDGAIDDVGGTIHFLWRLIAIHPYAYQNDQIDILCFVTLQLARQRLWHGAMVEENAISRIERRLAAVNAEGRAALIPFIMAGDPDLDTSLDVLTSLPEAGADLIELGVCFTDPMADGPSIQDAGLRALSGGQTLSRTLDMVEAFRVEDQETPIILMGYLNPFLAMGIDKFLDRAVAVGVDGLIIVDVPPEEDDEICLPARACGIDFIRLVTPTTDEVRLPSVLRNTSGFLYYVSVAGVTGKAKGDQTAIESALTRIRGTTSLPLAVGFGVRTPADVAAFAQVADAVVVGSALVEKIALMPPQKGQGLDTQRENPQYTKQDVLSFVKKLRAATRR